jgi:hypothetical protein
MNFAEGAKRVYITIACLVWVISAVALFDDRPKEDRYDWTTADALKDEVATMLGTTRYGVDWGNQSNSEFVRKTCSTLTTKSTEATKRTCFNHEDAQKKLPKDLAIHAAYSVGILALVAIGAALLWMLMAWIGRGFVSGKKADS